MDGVNIGKTGKYSNKKAVLAQRVGRLNSKQLEFIYQVTNNNRFLSEMNKLSVGNAIKHISLKQISDYSFAAPINEKEQEKIGIFFKQLDETIALHQRKLTLLEQLKQAYLQQMFPNNGENVPALRIAGFTEHWEERRLGDVSERVRGNDGRMNLPTLTISAGSGWLDQRERFSGNIAGNEQQNYTLLSNGELSYNHGNSKLAKYGAVFTLRTFKEALVPRVYHSFRTNYFATADFIEFMFATKRQDSELAKLVSSGARMDGLLNINYDDFMGINIIIPKIEEQNRISNFLSRFDDTITIHRQKVSQLQALKNTLLKKMFI
jgi:type I restriction enzyme S subunit